MGHSPFRCFYINCLQYKAVLKSYTFLERSKNINNRIASPSKMKQNTKSKTSRTRMSSKELRKLQKSRPKRYMTPFLCFLHEERKKANNGQLLSNWKAAHKGLGSKWRALGTTKAKFQRKGKIPAFAVFVKECAKRKEILPEWRKAHKGLGAKWKSLDKAQKAKYIAASKKMRDSYQQLMKTYRVKRINLINSIKFAKKAKRISKKKKIGQQKRVSFRAKAKKAVKKRTIARKTAKPSHSKKKSLARKFKRARKQKKLRKNVEMAPSKKEKRQYF